MSSFYGCAGGSGSGGGSGTPGVGIKTAQINEKGELILTYTNNVEQNVGSVVGKNGDNGVTFIPKIENNILSWENNGNLPNPTPVDFNTVEDQTTWDDISEDILSWGDVDSNTPEQTDTNYVWEEI